MDFDVGSTTDQIFRTRQILEKDMGLKSKRTSIILRLQESYESTATSATL